MTIALALTLSPAHACGGFFCNSLEPTQQSRERILFSVDPVADHTTMHVQVDYDGPANLFAWVVPVSGEPDLFLSSAHVFDVLEDRTAPTYTLHTSDLGECIDPVSGGGNTDSDGVGDSDEMAWNIDVLAKERVGPYETITVSADDPNGLVIWLQSQGYAVPMDLAQVIAPYLADGNNFVALRLASDEDVGSLAPLGMRYPGQTAAIPMHMTSVAAIDDMPVSAWILGPARAVPANFMHVTLNPAAVRWFDLGDGEANHADLLARAADEAGGHAFTTDHAGLASDFLGALHPSDLTATELALATSPTDFVERLLASGLALTPTVAELLDQVLSIPEGVEPGMVLACPACVTGLAWEEGFDAGSAALHVDERLLTPLEAIQLEFDEAQTLTRLATALSMSEMDLDPRFVFNTAIPQTVEAHRSAELVSRCDLGQDVRELMVDDYTITIPSPEALAEMGLDEQGWLDQLVEPAAIRIETYEEDAAAIIIWDGEPIVDAQIDDLNDRAVQSEANRGCDSTGSRASTIGAAFGFLVRRR